MADVTDLLARLRDEPRYTAALARLVTDEVLATPVREFLDPARIAPAFVAGLRAAVAAPGHTAWLEQRLRGALAEARPRRTALRARLPAELVPLLRAIVRRPYTPNRALVQAVVDHAGMRDLVRTILQTTLVDFARKVGSILPDASRIPGAGVTSKLFGVAKGMAAAVGFDASLEDRVRGFVDGALGKAIDMVVDRATDPRFAGESAAWRADVLAAVLDLPESALHAELQKLDPARLAADLHAALAVLAAWDRLPAEVEAALTRAVEVVGDATVEHLLAGSGLVEAWRERLEAEVRLHLGRVLVGPRFVAWLTHLAEGTLPPEPGESDMSDPPGAD